MRANVLGLVLVVLICGVGVEGSAGVLDGEVRSFVVIGNATSYRWPVILQGMLDEHAGAPGVYWVHNASVGLLPLSAWLGRSGGMTRGGAFDRMVGNYFSADAKKLKGEKPSIALVQQTLQWLSAKHADGIRGAEDVERIGAGAADLLALAERVRGLGVETVYVSMSIYMRRFEPGIENERFALDALVGGGHAFIRRGPALWGVMKAAYPVAYRGDGVHPSAVGSRLMAIGWYEVLAGDDAKGVIIENARAGLLDRSGERPTHRPRSVLPFAQRDMDGSGFLTANEYPGYQLSLFERIDRDDDNRISPGEYDYYRRGGDLEAVVER